MNILSRWFGNAVTPANYPPQIIPPKLLELIELMDDHFTKESVEQSNTNFYIEEVIIPLQFQHRALDKIFHPAVSNDYYIPRSIAFFTSANGDWVFLVGVHRRESTTPIATETQTRMWLELLNRTNNART